MGAQAGDGVPKNPPKIRRKWLDIDILAPGQQTEERKLRLIDLKNV